MFHKSYLHDNQSLFRGEILNTTVSIERKIDNYLSTHFCATKKKKDQLNELLLFTEKISLDMKRQIFIIILKLNKSEFLQKNPEFLKHLENIVPHRNIFAHLETIDPFESSNEDRKKLVFKKYTNGELKPKKYTLDDIVDLQVKLDYVEMAMRIILQELPPLS